MEEFKNKIALDQSNIIKAKTNVDYTDLNTDTTDLDIHVNNLSSELNELIKAFKIKYNDNSGLIDQIKEL
jgi:predicted  nucleic acid-binding Zn-ribbon protein